MSWSPGNGNSIHPTYRFLARPEPLFQCSFLLTADTSAGKEKAARCTPGHLVMLQIVIFDMAGLLVLDLLSSGLTREPAEPPISEGMNFSHFTAENSALTYPPCCNSYSTAWKSQLDVVWS